MQKNNYDDKIHNTGSAFPLWTKSFACHNEQWNRTSTKRGLSPHLNEAPLMKRISILFYLNFLISMYFKFPNHLIQELKTYSRTILFIAMNLIFCMHLPTSPDNEELFIRGVVAAALIKWIWGYFRLDSNHLNVVHCRQATLHVTCGAPFIYCERLTSKTGRMIKTFVKSRHWCHHVFPLFSFNHRSDMIFLFKYQNSFRNYKCDYKCSSILAGCSKNTWWSQYSKWRQMNSPSSKSRYFNVTIFTHTSAERNSSIRWTLLTFIWVFRGWWIF